MVLTSSTLSPKRAISSRFGTMVKLGWPNSRTTVMSAIPGTCEMMRFTFLALSSSVAKSPPKILTANKLFNPVSASSTASSAG